MSHQTKIAVSLLVACVALAEPSASADKPGKPKCERFGSMGECNLYEVSLIELIATPKAFDGKRVRVVGYVRIEFEGNAIYLSKESYDAHILKNALWLDPPRDSVLSQKHASWGPQYAIVEGEFYAGHRGHMSLFSGSIRNTTRLDPWK